MTDFDSRPSKYRAQETRSEEPKKLFHTLILCHPKQGGRRRTRESKLNSSSSHLRALPAEGDQPAITNLLAWFTGPDLSGHCITKTHISILVDFEGLKAATSR